MLKLLSIFLSSMVFSLFSANTTAETSKYLAFQPSQDSKALPIALKAEGSDFVTAGPLGNFILKIKPEDGKPDAFLRVDADDKKMYAYSKINPDKPVEEKQASRFQLIILNDYEIKLFTLRPNAQHKTKLATNDTPTLEFFQNILDSYTDMSKEELTQDEISLLIAEFAGLINFVTKGTTETDKTAYNNFSKKFDANVTKLIMTFQNMQKSPNAAQAFLSAVKSWDFGYTTEVEGAPKNNDVVVIFSPSANKYFSVIKDKGLDGKDMLHVAATAEDPVAASQFKVTEFGGRLGFICVSELGKNLALISTAPNFNSDVATVKRKLSRLMLQPRGDKTFGQPGTEAEQFEISGSADKFFLRSVAADAPEKGFLTMKSDDSGILRTYDFDKNPLPKNEADSNLAFLTISKFKDFYDSLFKARAEKNIASRLDVYQQLLTTISNVQNAAVLATEVRKLLTENKSSANLWEEFIKNYSDSMTNFVTKLNEIFADGLKMSDDDKNSVTEADKTTINKADATEAELAAAYSSIFAAQATKNLASKYPLISAKTSLITILSLPYIESLEADNYAIAIVDKDGNKKYLTMVAETDGTKKPENYDYFFKILANGTDPLNPASIFRLEIDTAKKTIQLESDFRKTAILDGKDSIINAQGSPEEIDKSGPNDPLISEPTALLYSKVKIADLGNDSALKYLGVYGWRDSKNKEKTTPEPQQPFNFFYEGSSQSMSFKNEKTDGYVTADSTDFTLKTIGDDGAAISTAGQNSKFALVRISKQQMDLAKIRAESIKKQLEFYLKIADSFDAKTNKDFREMFVAEVSKFVGRCVGSPANYNDAKSESTKMDLLVAAMIDSKKVSTYKVMAEKTAKIKEMWTAGFSGAFENNQWYAITFKEAEGVEKILRRATTKIKDQDAYKVEAVTKIDKSDEIEPRSNFMALVDADGSVAFFTEIDNKIYVLTVNDDAASSSNIGVALKQVLDGTLLEKIRELKSKITNAEKFNPVKNDDGSISLKSLKEADKYGFMTIYSADLDATIGNRNVSTLSELTKDASGIRDSDGNLAPSELARFSRIMLAPIHKKLSDARSIVNDNERLAKYIEFANYKDLTDDQDESIVAEIVAWIKKRAEVKADYDRLNADKAFTSKLTSLFDKAKNNLAKDSSQRAVVDATKDLWLGGFVGNKSEIIPAAGKKVLLMVKDLQLEDKAPAQTYFLRAVQNNEYEKIILSADSLSMMDEACLFEIMINGARIGFKSNLNEGKILMHTIDAAKMEELLEAAPRSKEIATALSFVDPEEAKFDQKTPNGAQFVLDASVTNAAAVAFKELTSSGFLNVAVDKETTGGKWVSVVRAINPQTLKAYEQKGKDLTLIVAGPLYEQAVVATQETEKAKQISLFNSLIKQVKLGAKDKPVTIDRMIFMQAFSKAFKDKPDFDFYKALPGIIDAAKKTWNIKYDDSKISAELATQLKSMEEISKTTLVIGQNYIKAILASADDATRKTKDQDAVVKKFASEQLAIFQDALDSNNWTDEKIKVELKLKDTTDDVTVKKNTVLILKERIAALDKINAKIGLIMKGLKDEKTLTAKESEELKAIADDDLQARIKYLLQKDPNGKLMLKEIADKIRRAKIALVGSRKDLDAIPTQTSTPATTNNSSSTTTTSNSTTSTTSTSATTSSSSANSTTTS